MATLEHAESRRLYSWWWDSHISPKNSKWLQENLTDMDNKIGAMIKLIEEDADSFAQRAEMFYKKRPELMKLVEEFYRAYRALAERYDHATGALHQAHQKMAEAFPNEIPLAFSDEPPSSATMADPHSANMEPIYEFFDPGGVQEDGFSVPSLLYDFKRDGDYSEQSDALESKTGLKQLSEMSAAGEGKASDYKILKKEISQLSKENEDLKSLISSVSARAEKAEIEVQRLMEKLSKSKSEKEHALLQYQQSLEKISNLENEISCTQEDLKKVNVEMSMGVNNLKRAEERCFLLGKGNQSLLLEVDNLQQKTRDLQEELNVKQGELKKLNISLHNEQLQSLQAETARISMEKLLAESQEEVRRLALELESEAEKLKDSQLSKAGLEQEVQKFKADNGRLNEQSLSSALKIINLQHEIISLKDAERKLKDEVSLHAEEKKVLQQELCRLKEDRHDIEKRHRELTERIQAVNLNVESLQALIKESRDGNVELKEIIKKYEDEKVHQLENQKHMEKISEKNAILENSLSAANFELEGLQGKIKALEDSCEYLRGKISIHLSEKAMLVSQVDAIAQNMGKLSEKNIFLENSLCDVHVELEGQRGKLKGLEESCQFLHDQNSDLLSEKRTLVSQVESIQQSLENMESMFADLEGKHSILEQEKDLTLHQVAELQELLRQEKEAQKTLNECSKNQLSTLENHICLLREEGRLREEELNMEQHKIISAQIEIFILQQCLCGVKESILILSEECRKHQEASRAAEKLISEVKEQNIIREKMIESLSEHNEKLREGVHLIFRVINLTRDYGSLDGIKDEVLLQLILHDIRHLLSLISDSRDEKQHLLLEKSVIVTLLEQIGLQMADLRSEKNALKQESKSRAEELSLLQREKHELLEMNEQLRQDLQVGNQREKILKAEMEILSQQLSDLQEVHQTLEREISAVIKGNHSLSDKFNQLQEEKNKLEEENGALVLEVLNMEYFYFIIRSSFADRMLKQRVLIRDREYLHGVRNELDQNVTLMDEEIGVVQVEKTHLKESILNVEDCGGHLVPLEDDLTAERSSLEPLNIQIGDQKNASMQKDMKMSQVNQEFHQARKVRTKSCREPEGLKLEMDGAKMAREELQNNISNLSEDYANRENEIACLLQANEMLKGEIDKLQRAVDELRSKEGHFASKLRKGIDEVKYCEEEIANLLNEIQFATTNAALFRDKVLDMIKRRESLKMSAMIQREALNEEITLRDVYVNELKEKLIVLEGENIGLKADLKTLLTHVVSLGDDIASLEAHTLSLTKQNASNNLENQSVSLQHKENCPESTKDHSIEATAGILKLQDLHSKVNALQNVVMDTRNLLEQERLGSNANIEAARIEIEELQSGVTDNEITKANYELMMKDIQLDLVSNTSKFGNGACSNRRKKRGNAETKKRGSAEDNDQMLELWGAVEVDCSNQIQKSPSKTVEHDFEFQQIEVDKEKGENPSCEPVAEKELGIDKQEPIRKVTAESHKEWSRKAIERLSSDAQRLSALQTSLQELKINIETSEECNSPAIFEFDTVKAQLKEAEGTISQLIDTNSKLMKKAEDINSSSENLVGEKSDIGSTSKRRISERARRVSEKIGRLELDLQKIQYVLLKFDERHVNQSTRTAERTSRTLLKEYIYGRREGRGQKKASSCGCIRLKRKHN